MCIIYNILIIINIIGLLLLLLLHACICMRECTHIYTHPHTLGALIV